MLRRPWDVCKMCSAETPISFPMLSASPISQRSPKGVVQAKQVGETDLCQCLTMAAVDSMMVPSMSKRKPAKAARCGGMLKRGCEPILGGSG